MFIFFLSVSRRHSHIRLSLQEIDFSSGLVVWQNFSPSCDHHSKIHLNADYFFPWLLLNDTLMQIL